MHESSLARQLLAAVLKSLEQTPAVSVHRVRGWLAETEALDASAIDFHFAAFAKGTAAEGAQLQLRLEHTEAQCSKCGQVYKPEHHLTLCPKCGALEATLLGRTGLGIESIDVE